MTPCSFRASGPSTRQAQSGTHTVMPCSEWALASSRHATTPARLSSVNRPRSRFCHVPASFRGHTLAPATPSAASSAASSVVLVATDCMELVQTHSVSTVCSTEAPSSTQSGAGEQTAARVGMWASAARDASDCGRRGSCSWREPGALRSTSITRSDDSWPSTCSHTLLLPSGRERQDLCNTMVVERV